MWEDSIKIELFDDLKAIPLEQRPLALAVIHERCVSFAMKKVSWYLGRPEVRERINDAEFNHIDQILIAEFLNNERYILLIIGFVRRYLPQWKAGESVSYLSQAQTKQKLEGYDAS